jgi:hypothetical protein
LIANLQDWFHICPGHLKDRGYCVPDEEELAAETAAKEKKAKEELEKEKEKVIKEYLEKKKQREERKKKKKEKGKDEDKDEKKDEKKEEDEEAEKEKKVKEIEEKVEKAEETGPQVFALNRLTFEQRRGRIVAKEKAEQSAELAKKTQQYIRTPGAFPSVPSGDPSKPKPPGVP